MSRASIIVPVWNGEAYLGDCLDGILGQIGGEDEVIVVDNGSADGSVALVRERYPQVNLIENGCNLGFAGGCNVGLRAAQGTNLLLLNQDVTVQEGWLAAMLHALALPGVGVAGCKLLYPDGTIQHAGGVVNFPQADSDHYGYRQADRGQWDEACEVDYVIGASMGLHRAVLDRIGPFDEGFFPAFYEDTDLCFRARSAGYRVLYVPDATGIHHETTTVDRASVDYHRWMGRGRLRFVLKHRTAGQFHGEFLPAERDWLVSVVDPATRAGMRMAYLDILLDLRAMPGTGALGETGAVEAVAEALVDLRQVAIPAQEETLPYGNVAQGLLDRLPWFIEERPFVSSRVPILAPVVAGLREMWNRVATKWYVRPLVEQQNAFNRAVVEELAGLQGRLAATQEIVTSLDRESTEARRLQVETEHALQGEVERLQRRMRALEEDASTAPQKQDGP